MFKYCIWYKLKEGHILHRCIQQYAKTFNTVPFPAHITVRHSLRYDEIGPVSPPSSYEPIGTPVVTCTVMDGRTFYAIEQPLTQGAHISFAYRFTPFSAAEVSVISPITRIFRTNLETCVADCSNRIEEWTVLYKMKDNM